MFNRRLHKLFLIFILLFAIPVARLAKLQLVDADVCTKALQDRQQRHQRNEALRGRIVDRTGQPLACSEPSFDICIIPSQMPLDIDEMASIPSHSWLRDVSDQLNVTPNELREKLRDISSRIETEARRERKSLHDWARGVWRSRPWSVLSGVSFAHGAYVELRPDLFPALTIRSSTRRIYPLDDLACHVVGYLSLVTEDDMTRYADAAFTGSGRKSYLSPEGQIGRTGIEALHNLELRGYWGSRDYVVDANGRLVDVLDLTPPMPGETVTLTLDHRIQRKAEEFLDDNARDPDMGSCQGAVVVLDVATGEILALANSARYDLNTFRRDYRTIADDPRRPLVNRATSGAYAPGSVFKIVTATAALEAAAGPISASAEFLCQQHYRLGNHTFRCEGLHNYIAMTEALERSCNIFFIQAGLHAGADELTRWADLYGFGRATGLDLPGEFVRPLPRLSSKGSVANVSIGQGSLMVSPLQVAQMMAAVANGGRIIRPHLTNEEGRDYFVRTLPISAGTLRTIREGLLHVVEGDGGTGRTLKVPGLRYAAKTGTAEVGTLNNGWYAGFAPYDNPRISFAVVQEKIPHGVHGGSSAGPIAQELLNYIFNELPAAPAQVAVRQDSPRAARAARDIDTTGHPTWLHERN